MKTTIDLVNNTGSDLRPFYGEILSSLRATGALPEEVSDLFTVTVLRAYNSDGSDRFVIEAA